MKKTQVPSLGGFRKMLIPSSTISTGTAIDGLQSSTISIAQLAKLVGAVNTQNTGGGNIGTGAEASIALGPGLSGGGPLIGNVPIRLSIPPALIPEDGLPGEDGMPGTQGPSGLRGLQGIPGLWGDDGADGDPGPSGMPGIAGATGATGATGPQGLTWIGEDTSPEDSHPIVHSLGILGPTTIIGNMVIYGAPTFPGNPSGFIFKGADIVVARLESTSASNRCLIRFDQQINAAIPAMEFGVDGTQVVLSDSVNSDGVCICGTSSSFRFGFGYPGGVKSTFVLSSTSLKLPTTPLTSGFTQAFTGLANFKSIATTSTGTTLTTDSSLAVTCNEIGWYDVNVFLSFYETTLGTGGFQFDFNGGNAGLGSFVARVITNQALGAAFTSSTTITTFSTISTNSAIPSWAEVHGCFNVTTTGSVAIRWSQASILATDSTNLTTGSNIILTKIG